GLSSGYVGTVGDDERGRLIRDVLEKEGVDVSGLRVADGPNAYCRVNVVAGERVFEAGDIGMSSHAFAPRDLRLASGATFLHTGDNSEMESVLAELARVTRVSYDFGTRPEKYCRPLLPHVWMATFSVDGSDPDEAGRVARWASRQGPAVVLVTEGAAGASLSVGGGLVHLPSATSAPTDTLGAGDAAIAGVLAGLVRGLSPGRCLDQGMELAADVCRDYGAFGYGVPSRGEDEP
ncbi:MAG: PfkB family carbohydrate kinase, partial [Acidimicrobiales bacterium]